MDRLVKMYGILLILFFLSNCEGTFYDPLTSQEIDAFPTTFQGLEHNLVFTSGDRLMLLSRQNNQVSEIELRNTEHKPHHLRIGSNGKYLYFVDRMEGANHTGSVFRHDFENNRLTKLAIEPVRDMILLNDEYLLTSSTETSCPVTHVFRMDFLIRISNGNKISFCDVYAQYAAIHGTPETGSRTPITYNDGIYTSYFHNFTAVENENVRRDFKVSFALTGGQLTVVDFQELNEPRIGKFTQDERYQLKIIDNEGLFIKNMESRETNLIDASVRSIQDVHFVINDTHVMVRKERDYSRELFRKYGFHLYEIATGRYFQVLEESQDMRMLRFSESGNQMVAVAQFRNNNNWLIVVMSYDQQRKAIVSNREISNSFPLFVY